MNRKDHLDRSGVLLLTGFSVFLGFNQIVIKFVNHGLQPVFFAGLRSAIAALCVALWMVWRGQVPQFSRQYALQGVAAGLAFSGEFLFLFIALDLTTVTRTSILLYSMPVWMAIAAHFVLPGERITPARGLGLLLAFAGVSWAILSRGGPVGQASLAGDICAVLASWCWAGIALIARGTRLREVPPEMQLLWQLLVSAVVLLVASLFFGPLIRDFQPMHVAGLLFQAIAVAAAGYVLWLWLLSVYPASSVASFSFLTPIFGVALGWMIMGDHLGLPVLGAALLVAVGIILINRPRPAPRPRA